MSQNSSKRRIDNMDLGLDMRENIDNYIDNRGDTFKEEKQIQNNNIFNQNYNIDEEEKEIENLNNEENLNNNVEIFEDVNNHVEEIKNDDEYGN